MPNVFSLPLGPSLGHQLLHALLHHIHPILWRSGIPVSPHFCQVGDKGSPCCSPLPPVPNEPSLSSAVPHRPSLFRFSAVIDLTVCCLGYYHCFTYLPSSPSSTSSQQRWFWCSASSSALVMVPPGLSFLSVLPVLTHCPIPMYLCIFSALVKAGPFQSPSGHPLPSLLGRQFMSPPEHWTCFPHK